MKRSRSIYILCILILFAFAFMSIASAEGSSSSALKSEDKEESLADKLVGTYYGVNGSILVLFEKGNADYFYRGHSEVIHNNSWEYDKNENQLIVNMKETAIFGSYSVKADLSNGVEEFYLIAEDGLDNLRWDDEKYYRISDETGIYTPQECEKLIEDNLGTDPLNEITASPTPTSKPKPTATATPLPTKPPTTTTQTAYSSSSSEDLKTPCTFIQGNLGVGVAVRYFDSIPGDTLGMYQLSSGCRCLVVLIGVKNGGNSDAYISTMTDVQVYADNKLCEEFTLLDLETPSYATISSGRETTICGVYEVPSNASSVEIEIQFDWLADKAVVLVDQES